MRAQWIAALSALSFLAGCGPDRDPQLYQSGDDEKSIVGGNAASAGEYPHQISLQTRSGFHYCGGSLIDANWVLTAAHCVVGDSASSMRVEIGMNRLSSGGEAFNVAQVIVHSGYNANTNQNDVALLRLSRAATGHTTIPLIDAAAEAQYGTPGTLATVTGWGDLSSNGGSPDALQEVDVPIVSNSVCDNAYTRENITNQMVCAGYIGQGGRDSCQGDSGGPLVVDVPGGHALMGVVSWGYGCADPRYPGVYARVSQYNAWLDSFGVNYSTVGDDPTTPPVDPPSTGDDHGDQLEDATVLDIPDGAWVLDAELDAGDTDVFRLELEGTGTLSLSTTGSTDTFGTLYDTAGNELASDDDGGANTNFLIDVADAGGVYYLAVRGYAGSTTGAYQLQITADLAGSTEPPAPPPAPPAPPAPPVTDDHGDEPANATPVALPAGSTASGNATLLAGDLDVFAVTMSSAGTLTASTTGNTDTYGLITTASGQVLAQNDDTNGLQMRVSANVAAGTYYVWIRGYSTSTTGPYGFTIAAN